MARARGPSAVRGGQPTARSRDDGHGVDALGAGGQAEPLPAGG